MDNSSVIRKKRGLGLDENEQEEELFPARKRRKVVDSGTQITPKKEMASLDVDLEDSPFTKTLIMKAQEMEKTLGMTREAIELRRRSRNLLNGFRMST